jgi:hypothetical protein
MDKITEREKEIALMRFEAGQKKKYRTGMAIVVTIASINIILSLISFLVNFNIVSLIIQVSLSVALFCGVTWVRYLFAIIDVFYVFALLVLLREFGYAPIELIIISVTLLLYYTISCIVLFASKSVSEFLYSKSN